MGNQELPPGYIKNESRDPGTEIGLKTVEQENEGVLWDDAGAVTLEAFGEEIVVKAREIKVENNGNYFWQYGILYANGSVKKDLAIYEDKEKAIKGGIDIAEIEIRTIQQED